jgi:two-component system response regulator YesN
MNHTFADELDAVIAGLADSNEKPDVCSWKRLSQWAAGKLILPAELKEAVVKAIGKHSAGNKENYGISKGIWQAQTMSELTDAIRHILELENNRQHKYRKEINSAIEIIKGNLDKPLGLSAIAEDVGISSRYLSRLFSEELGESFIDYVTRTRMEKAVELLKTTNMKVYEISEKIGIPSYRYFSALFKNWTGKTPKEFKRI